MKAWLKYTVNEVCQHDGHQGCWAKTLHPKSTKGKCIIVCWLLPHDILLPSYRPVNINNCKFCTKINIKYQNSRNFYQNIKGTHASACVAI